MDKDDILAKSRAENRGSDEYEKLVLQKAGRLSGQVGMVVCCVIAIASVIVTGRINYGCWVIYFSIHATVFGVKYRYLKKRHELGLAVVSALVGVEFLILYVLELAGVLYG